VTSQCFPQRTKQGTRIVVVELFAPLAAKNDIVFNKMTSFLIKLGGPLVAPGIFLKQNFKIICGSRNTKVIT
jgi:hypothetical protein